MILFFKSKVGDAALNEEEDMRNNELNCFHNKRKYYRSEHKELHTRNGSHNH